MNPDYPRPKVGEPPLHVASRLGDHDAIRRIVSKGVPVDELFDVALDPGARRFPATPLMQAVASVDGASVETVELLLDLGASIEPPLLGSILGCAVGGLGWNYPSGGDAARLQAVIDAARRQGLQLPASTEERHTPNYLMADAAEAGDPDRVRILLDAGLDPDPGGLTYEWQWPIHQAVESGSVPTVQVLLEAGVDPNKRLGRFGDLLLGQARSPEMLEVLLDAGTAVEPRMVLEQGRYDEPDGAEQVVASLANASAPLAIRVAMLHRVIEARSITPDQVAQALRNVVFRSERAGVEALLAAGADPQRQPRLLHAVCFGAMYGGGDEWDPERVIELLIEAGLDPDDEDERGFRPLMTAMSPDTFGDDYQESDGYNSFAALALIRGGVEVNIVYPDTDVEPLEQPKVAGWTPLLVAAHYGDGPIVEALLDAGADPRATTPQGSTPLDLAQVRVVLEAEAAPPAPPAEGASRWRRREYDQAVRRQGERLRNAEHAVASLGDRRS